MFNQPHSARAAVAWQPNAGIAKKLSSRGYTATSWTSDEPQAFAEFDYPAKSSGFSAAHYQPTQQKLSKQAQASLALLEGESRNTGFDTEPSKATPLSSNEHLPFVMDAYAATRQSKLRIHVDEGVLQRALDHAELAENLVLSPITSDERVADPIVIHPDVPDTKDTSDDDALRMLEALATPPVSADANAEMSADALSSEEASVQEAGLSEDVSGTDEDVHVSAEAAAPEVEVVEPAEPELPAVVGGIDPEEVAQREAEQFAKGLAQAREEAQAELAQAVAQAQQEALAQGLEQGRADGLAEGLQQGLEQGMAQGKAEGEASVRAEMADEMAAQRQVFENAAHELQALMADPKQFFEPLKRLSIHIAEQLVLGELQASAQGIERLVQRCLDELDHPVQGAVVLELNPQDKEVLQTQAPEFIQGMRLEAVHDMQRGSVRVFANDTVVEDLVAHRLQGLAKALLVDVAAWREHSHMAQEVTEVQAKEEEEDDDVHS